MTGQDRHDPGPARRMTSPGSRRPRRGALTATCILAVTLTAGWAVLSSHGGAARQVPVPSDRPATAVDEKLLHQAAERLIARCMARHGFAYTEQRPPPPTTEPDLRYPLDDVGWARRHGYGTLLAGSRAAASDPDPDEVRNLTPEQREAWYRTLMGSDRALVVDLPERGRLTTSDDGCTAEARRALYGDLAGWYRARRTVDHFGSYTLTLVTADPGYRAGLTAWAGCVHKHGYIASSPDELRELVARTEPTSTSVRPPAAEIAAAVTEAECTTSTGFSRTLRTLKHRYQTQTERRFARELTALKSYELQAMPRARRALADS